jgi:IclR family transcriptional regulator, mhp operon transcriptional activator
VERHVPQSETPGPHIRKRLGCHLHTRRDRSVPGTQTIRSLERGLQVLRALQPNRISSLADIYAVTGIPKPTLLRILNTLIREGVISRRLADGHYRISALTHVTKLHDRYDRIAEAAVPVLNRLCQKVLWPSDLLVPAGDHMEVRETTRTHSPLVFHLNHIGRSVGWLLTGVGRAYLAFCPAGERQKIVQKLQKSDKPDDLLARDPKRLARILAETHERGYGIRDPGFIGGRYGSPPLDDGLAAIAVPLLDRTRVHGSINVLWIRTAFSVEEFAVRHLGDLQVAAHEIVSSLQASARSRSAG